MFCCECVEFENLCNGHKERCRRKVAPRPWSWGGADDGLRQLPGGLGRASGGVPHRALRDLDGWGEAPQRRLRCGPRGKTLGAQGWGGVGMGSGSLESQERQMRVVNKARMLLRLQGRWVLTSPAGWQPSRLWWHCSSTWRCAVSRAWRHTWASPPLLPTEDPHPPCTLDWSASRENWPLGNFSPSSQMLLKSSTAPGLELSLGLCVSCYEPSPPPPRAGP